MVCRAFRNKHPTNSGMHMHAQHSLSAVYIYIPTITHQEKGVCMCEIEAVSHKDYQG